MPSNTSVSHEELLVIVSTNHSSAQAQEMEDMSEMDFEDDMSDDDDEGEPIDLRALVGKGKPKSKPSSDEPPKKKQKK